MTILHMKIDQKVSEQIQFLALKAVTRQSDEKNKKFQIQVLIIFKVKKRILKIGLKGKNKYVRHSCANKSQTLLIQFELSLIITIHLNI